MFSSCSCLWPFPIFYWQKQEQDWTSRLNFDLCILARDSRDKASTYCQIRVKRRHIGASLFDTYLYLYCFGSGLVRKYQSSILKNQSCSVKNRIDHKQKLNIPAQLSQHWLFYWIKEGFKAEIKAGLMKKVGQITTVAFIKPVAMQIVLNFGC